MIRHKKLNCLIGLALLSALFFCSVPRHLSRDSSEPPIKNKALNPSKPRSVNFGLPVRLVIPAIQVDAAIGQVSLTSTGAMEAPKNPSDIVWYGPGPRPGQPGNAVIAGHYGPWASGERSVFDQLHVLRPGDTMHTIDDTGATTTFVVRESRRYDPAADTGDVFGPGDGTAHLNLITCEGTWDKISQSYPRRLVVFADKKTDPSNLPRAGL